MTTTVKTRIAALLRDLPRHHTTYRQRSTPAGHPHPYAPHWTFGTLR